MRKGTTIHLSGANVADTAKVLGMRLIELGHNAELLDADAVTRLGGATSAAHAGHLLARNGVVVIVTAPEFSPEGDTLAITVDPNDTPDFAAEKILDSLAEAGVISLETGAYSDDEEEEIRRRLANLGYIE